MVFSFRRPNDRIHAVRYARVEIAFPELRHNFVVYDLAGDGVGQSAFEAVTNLDPDRAVFLKYQKNHSIVAVLLAHFPFLGKPDRKIFERTPFKTLKNSDYYLIGGLLLELGKCLGKLCLR